MYIALMCTAESCCVSHLFTRQRTFMLGIIMTFKIGIEKNTIIITLGVMGGVCLTVFKPSPGLEQRNKSTTARYAYAQKIWGVGKGELPKQYQTEKSKLSGWASILPVSQQIMYSTPVTISYLLQDQMCLKSHSLLH